MLTESFLIFNGIIGWGTLIIHVALVIGILSWLLPPLSSVKEKVSSWLHTYGARLALSATLAGIVGSLIYSELFLVPPCTLCWWQRIFIYPQVIILAYTYQKPTRAIMHIILTLSAIGLFFSLYHYLLQMGATSTSVFCGASAEVSCNGKEVFEFGYITIPLMAATVLITSSIGILFQKKSD